MIPRKQKVKIIPINIKCGEYDNVKEQLLAWCDLCDAIKIQEFIDASNTIENWIDNITHSFLDNRYLY